MDYIKRRMNELDAKDAPMIGNVHDEVLFEGDHVESPEFKKECLETLQVRDGLNVPMVWDWGTSRRSWKHAGA